MGQSAVAEFPLHSIQSHGATTDSFTTSPTATEGGASGSASGSSAGAQGNRLGRDFGIGDGRHRRRMDAANRHVNEADRKFDQAN